MIRVGRHPAVDGGELAGRRDRLELSPQASPGWLQGFATHQPVSVVINAARSLIMGDSATAAQRAALLGDAGTASLILQSLAWTIGIGAIFGVLCARKYRSLTR